MTGPIWFEFLLAAVGAASVAIQLRTGRLDLHRAPAAYRQAARTNDPGRYWAFIVGVSIVTLAMFVEAIYRSFA
jgi:hypothetical protein